MNGVKRAVSPASVSGTLTFPTRIHVSVTFHFTPGTAVPTDCAAYGTRCTPRTPLGAPMVSAEGTCAAFHHAGRRPSTVEATR